MTLEYSADIKLSRRPRGYTFYSDCSPRQLFQSECLAEWNRLDPSERTPALYALLNRLASGERP